MAMDYDGARRVVGRLAEKAERQELESDEELWGERTTDEEKSADRENAVDLRSAIEIGGGLLVDIAESLNKIAKGDKLSSGRRL